jgi:hypothetical protein
MICGLDVISVINDHVLDRIKVDGQWVLVVESDASHFTYGRISILVGSAQARLKLYSYLEQLGPRALYADTDSVVYTSRPGEWKPELGDYLGDLTDETIL